MSEHIPRSDASASIAPTAATAVSLASEDAVALMNDICQAIRDWSSGGPGSEQNYSSVVTWFERTKSSDPQAYSKSCLPLTTHFLGVLNLFRARYWLRFDDVKKGTADLVIRGGPSFGRTVIRVNDVWIKGDNRLRSACRLGVDEARKLLRDAHKRNENDPESHRLTADFVGAISVTLPRASAS